MNTEFVSHLRALQPAIEESFVRAVSPAVGKAMTTSVYERSESLRDLLALSSNGDAMYDRPTVGVAYALWYQNRRMHDAVRALADELTATDDDVTILDLGSGTGATWWACAAIETARLQLGFAARSIRIVAVEASVPMFECGQELWTRLGSFTSLEVGAVDVDARLASWATLPTGTTGAIAYAGYLLDASPDGRAAQTGAALGRTLEAAGASTVVLASTSAKISAFRDGIAGMAGSGWEEDRSFAPERTVFDGAIVQVQALRRELHADLSESMQKLAWQPPTWRSVSTEFTRLVRRETVATPSLPFEVASTTPMLDPAQDAAADPDSRLTAVIGAAGSGKSRVLVERLIRSFLLPVHKRPRRVLVTAFNKLVVNQLATWFEDAAARTGEHLSWKARSDGAAVCRLGHSEVTFLNWDKVPTRIFGAAPLRSRVDIVDAFDWVLEDVRACDDGLGTVVKRLGWTGVFLAEEWERVVYGLGALTHAEYMVVGRRGRQRSLVAGHRSHVWQLFERRRTRDFIDVRMAALQRVRAGHRVAMQFDQVYVDECQDLLPADFELVNALVADPNRIAVYGDETQALNTGSSYQRPRSLVHGGAGPRRTWKKHPLEGSYRLPIRVCEAVEPLAIAVRGNHVYQRSEGEAAGDSDAAHDVVLPHAVKTAVLGVRPIVIAGSRQDVETDLAAIVREYRPLLLSGTSEPIVTVAEGDDFLEGVLKQLEADRLLPSGMKRERSSMRRIKGLERPFVVWSTRARIPQTDTCEEWIYTILTRSTALAVIALSRSTPPEVRACVRRLRRDRLMFWTEDAEAMFDHWVAEASASSDRGA